MRFRPDQHLRQARDFLAVRQLGRGRECGPYLLQMRLVNVTERPPVRRLGVIASKRLGNAPERNRAKRRLRELFRQHQEALPANCDVVMIARRRVLEAPWDDLVWRFHKTLGNLLPSSTTVEPPEPTR